MGEIDEAAGEFWTHPFDMPRQGDNLSAYERNRLFLNAGDDGFLDASFASGADLDSDSRSAMVADFNGDLAPDLLVGSAGGGPLRLFLNNTQDAHRVAIRLRGRSSNREGIGARVTIETADRRMIRDLFSANGFMGQSPPRLYVGLGPATVIERLTVDWPSGQRDTFTDVPGDVHVTVTEGAAELAIDPPNVVSAP